MSRNTSKQLSRRPPQDAGTAAGSTDKDAEWGFSKDADEKTIEPRLGLVLVTCLLLMFGFVLYNKYQQTKAGGKLSVEVAQTVNAEAPVDTHESAAMPQPLVDQTHGSSTLASSEYDPFGEQRSAQTAPKPAPTPAAEPTPEFNPFYSDSVTATRAASPLPAQSEPSPFADETFVPPPADRSEPVDTGAFEVAQSATQASPQADAMFDLSPGSVESQPRVPVNDAQFEPLPSNARVIDASTPEPDPFGFPAEPEIAEVESFDGHAVAEQAPQPLETMELAMPLAPQETETDPFSGSAFDDEPTRPIDPEPSPFGDVATAKPTPGSQPVDALAFPSSDLPAQSQSAAQEQPRLDFSGSSDPTPPPALPDLPNATPSNAVVAEKDFGWELERVPTSPTQPPTNQRPAFDDAPQLTQTRPFDTSFSFSEPEAVIGEREVTVTRNDSLWSIAQEAYGTARYVPALAQYNKDHVPHADKLSVGDKLRIPPPEVLETRFPSLFVRSSRRDAMISPAGGQTAQSATTAQDGYFLDPQGRPSCRVGEDDTLSRIAQRYLGRASRWIDIYGINGDQLKSPEALKPGMVLRLPSDAKRIAVDGNTPRSR